MIVVEGDPKAPFSIVTTPRCWGGHYSLSAPPYPWYVPYNAERYARRYQVPFFESLIWLYLGLNPSPPCHWRALYPLVYFFKEEYFLNNNGTRTLISHWQDVRYYVHVKTNTTNNLIYVRVPYIMLLVLVHIRVPYIRLLVLVPIRSHISGY